MLKELILIINLNQLTVHSIHLKSYRIINMVTLLNTLKTLISEKKIGSRTLHSSKGFGANLTIK